MGYLWTLQRRAALLTECGANSCKGGLVDLFDYLTRKYGQAKTGTDSQYEVVSRKVIIDMKENILKMRENHQRYEQSSHIFPCQLANAPFVLYKPTERVSDINSNEYKEYQEYKKSLDKLNLIISLQKGYIPVNISIVADYISVFNFFLARDTQHPSIRKFYEEGTHSLSNADIIKEMKKGEIITLNGSDYDFIESKKCEKSFFWCHPPENQEEVIKNNAKINELVNYLNSMDDFELLGLMAEKGYIIEIPDSDNKLFQSSSLPRPDWMPDNFVKDFIKDQHIFKILSSRYPDSIKLIDVKQNKKKNYNLYLFLLERLN